jgi:hypothetical protein
MQKWMFNYSFSVICGFFVLALLPNQVALAATTDGRWHPGIGDPTVFGWITVLFYAIAMCMSARLAFLQKKSGGRYQFWLFLALFLLLLGINKQLDLQTWFTQTLREAAHLQGWYDYRRPLQVLFIATLGFGMLAILLRVRRFLADAWRLYKVTWLGIALLCSFILIRAASFHHMDVFIHHRMLGLKFNVLLEIGAILVIMAGTFIKYRVYLRSVKVS